MKKLIIGALLISALSGNANAHLTPDEQAAKSRGILLFNQYKNAQPELRIAAEAGDAEAQFYLAERLRKEKQFMTAEAQKWYEESANQNNVYAMIQLGRSGDNLCVNMGNCPESTKTPAQWLKGALDLTKPVAESGDPEAMYLMYELTLKDEWLEKSANSGYALAQYWMAIGTRQGDGFFLPWKRHEAIGNWKLEIG
jgi:TPR repeat protein